MRIGTYTQINQMYNMNNTKKSSGQAAVSGYGSFQDAVSFSSNGKDMQTAKNALKQVPDVREELVSSIKNRINAGTYEVNSMDFASKLVETFSNSTF